jgi:hypothetical protein
MKNGPVEWTFFQPFKGSIKIPDTKIVCIFNCFYFWDYTIPIR